MDFVKEFKLIGDFRIWIKFNDGFETTINIKPLLGKGISTQLPLHLKRFQSNQEVDWLGKMDLISAQITFGKLHRKKIIQLNFSFPRITFRFFALLPLQPLAPLQPL